MPGQEANVDTSGMYFLTVYKIMVIEAILMSTQNIHFHDKIREYCFLELSLEFPRDSKTSSNHPG